MWRLRGFDFSLRESIKPCVGEIFCVNFSVHFPVRERNHEKKLNMNLVLMCARANDLEIIRAFLGFYFSGSRTFALR